MSLFADKGFRETTVGEIEAAAGLEPRRGALYRHYPSKEALLEAALRQHLDALSDPAVAFAHAEVGDREDQFRQLGRWLLAELDRERAIVRILEQDGGRLPELRRGFRRTLVEPAYRILAGLLRETAGSASDIDAVAAALLGGLVNYRRSVWTFDVVPAGVTEGRFLDSWAQLCVVASSPADRRRGPRPPARHRRNG